VVAAEVSHFAFHTVLLVALAGRAELGLILPVGAEGDEACRQLAFLATQYFLHRAQKVIVAKVAKDAIEVRKRGARTSLRSLPGGELQ
jgi:hypothetical protein